MDQVKKTAGEMLFLFQEELRSAYPPQEIRAILYRLFDHYLGWSRATLQMNKGKTLDKQTAALFLEALSRLNRGEPVQYITGVVEFCGLTLKVQPGVLIPRPETEELAVLVARENQHLREKRLVILDLGTGSGCLALAMKQAFPLALVTGVDNGWEALDVARENAVSNRLDVSFLEGDLLHAAAFILPLPVDIILSNPPYIPAGERNQLSRHVADHEPAQALFVPADRPLLFYEAIASLAISHLKPGGLLYVEIHEELGEATGRVFLDGGLTGVEITRDMFGKERFIRASAPG